MELVFEQAMTIERCRRPSAPGSKPACRKSKVVLIRTMISDQLRYINIAKEWFTLCGPGRNSPAQRLVLGRIGGKAAGMLLATAILDEVADPKLQRLPAHARILLHWVG